MDKLLMKKVNTNSGKRWVIGDIHGCYLSLKQLLETIQPNKEDHLIFLGDYIDRGPNSYEVLELLIELDSQLNCHFLRGNHEQMLLDAYRQGTDSLQHQLSRLNGMDLLRNGKLNDAHLHFFKQSLHYIICGEYLMVHAGIAEQNWQENEQALLWIRDFKVPASFPYTVVHGHVPTSLSVIEHHIRHPRLNKIPLDGGCVYKDSLANLGLLCALELNSKELVKVDCLDF